MLDDRYETGCMMKKEKRTEKGKKKNFGKLLMLVEVILIIAALMVAGLIYVRMQVAAVQKTSTQSFEEMKRHYAFITTSVEDNFRNKIYEGAKQYAEEEGIYLEWFGKELAIDYSKIELLKMAITSEVDGIILEGDDSEEIQGLIDWADEEGIPVVTVLTDSYNSKRKSFVGISNHNLGREYGRQIIKIANKETKEAMLLIDVNAEDSGQNIILNGIKETLANEGNHLNIEVNTLAISADSAFEREEAIQSIFLNREELPEIIICLNEENTISVYQAAVDYNLVGEINILGYSANETILNAISRNVIVSTAVVDYEQMGIHCVQALDEYLEANRVNDFVTIDVSTVTKKNVERYLEDAGE